MSSENKKTINLNTQENISFLLFPDNQPHVTISGVREGDDVEVICSITSSLTLINLLQTANAIENIFAVKKILIIPYLMAARYDRQMNPGGGESFDLKVISDLINSMDFEKVVLYDVHSEVSLALINNSVNITNRMLVNEYYRENSLLIIPDAGAIKKSENYFKWNDCLTDSVQCLKKRDLSNGNISLTVLEPEKCAGRNCVIIDDLCDGGGTFLAIASQIAPKTITLIVTHGIFSKGFGALEKQFDEIIVSNSYTHAYNSNKVKTIAL